MRHLTETEIIQGLEGLPGWVRQANTIERVFEQLTFQRAMAFVNTLSDLAGRADRHPDIDIRFTRVRVAFTPREGGGITDRDVAMARQITAASE